jgi:hypothetical protein
MMEELSSPETSVLTRAKRRNIPEDAILHSHRCENLKPYMAKESWNFKMILSNTNFLKENALYFDGRSCGFCKNLRLRGTYSLLHQIENNLWGKNNVSSNYQPKHPTEDSIFQNQHRENLISYISINRLSSTAETFSCKLRTGSFLT